jgi:hypothetical protein
MSATTKPEGDLKPGDLVGCGACREKLTPYQPPYPPDEQLCDECQIIIADMMKDGTL